MLPSRQEPISGLVLAGGQSRRMGQNKAFLELDGQPLISIVTNGLLQVCAEVLVVANDVYPYEHVGLPVVRDLFRNVGALGGLHAGLAAASHDLALVVACDMPFVDPLVLRAFADWAEGFDVVVLRQGEHTEPLHAAYRRSCLPAIESAISAGKHRIISFFPEVRVRYVTPAQVTPFDSELSSFRNINTLREWKSAQELWARRAKPPPPQAA